MEKHKNLNAAINHYREQGFSLDFELREDCLACQRLRAVMEPHEFEIDTELAFPDEQAYLYPVSTIYSAKGLLQLTAPVNMADLAAEMQAKFGAALA